MNKKVLLIDDDAHLLGALERNLRVGYQVTTATSGALGLQKMAADGPFAVVVADMQMPEMDGIQLLREIQRLKSEGDYNAAKNLVENYGVKVDQDLRAEVHKRYEKLHIAPYQGFIQAELVPVMKHGEISDVKVKIPENFLEQMMEYGQKYSFLPVHN